jgi:uncharacterized protein
MRIHVDRDNVTAIPALLEDIQAAFGADERYEVFIRGLSRLGGPNDPTLPILEGEGRTTTIAGLRALAASRGIRVAAIPLEPSICYAARGNSFVIRADGRVNKCTVALDHPANQVGTLKPDGSLSLRSERIHPWMRGFDSGDRAVLACPMRGLAEGPVTPTPGPRPDTAIPVAVGGP